MDVVEKAVVFILDAIKSIKDNDLGTQKENYHYAMGAIDFAKHMDLICPELADVLETGANAKEME